jgi:imidazolonepropionase
MTVADELRSLEIAGRATGETTFLGAHVVPAEYKARRDEYVSLVAGDMLTACAPHARWIDVFCDRGAFDVDETRTILQAGADAGLGLRMHAGQLGPGKGIQLAVQMGAASVDHCTFADDGDLEALAAGSTVATLLPGAEFSTRAPWPDGRRFVEAGVTIALATDCNPGTSYTSSMPFCIALAVRDMHLTPAEALRAATAGGAAALRRGDIGVLAPGKRADFVTLNAPSYIHLAYRPGVPIIDCVVVGGAPTNESSTNTHE